jgi:hypothetical protein
MMEANGATKRPTDTPLDPIELGVLEACYEAGVRRREMLPHLADAIGVAPDEVFYAWVLKRRELLERHGQHGRVGQTGWTYFFHGYECDLTHGDGRLLRYDFGPGGRVDTFTSWGVLQYIMTSALPWSGFLDLKARLARDEPARAAVAGDDRKMAAVWGALDARGVFQPAEPELVAFRTQYTSVGPDGITYVRYPPDTPEEIMIDCAVAHRPILSPVGLRLLNDYAVGQPEGARR